MPDEDFNIYGDDETFGIPAEVRVTRAMLKACLIRFLERRADQ